MEESIVTHLNKDTKYRVSYEQSATKGIMGFKVEAHSDNLEDAISDATILLQSVSKQAKDYSDTTQ